MGGAVGAARNRRDGSRGAATAPGSFVSSTTPSSVRWCAEASPSVSSSWTKDVAMHNLYGAMNHVPLWFRGRRKKDLDAAAAAVASNLLRLFHPSAGPGR